MGGGETFRVLVGWKREMGEGVCMCVCLARKKGVQGIAGFLLINSCNFLKPHR